MEEDAKVDDLIVRNRLLMAQAFHVRRDTRWLREAARAERTRRLVRLRLAEIRKAWATSRQGA
jgi:hypothetical protein